MERVVAIHSETMNKETNQRQYKVEMRALNCKVTPSTDIY